MFIKRHWNNSSININIVNHKCKWYCNSRMNMCGLLFLLAFFVCIITMTIIMITCNTTIWIDP
eukprot:UN08059